MLKKYLENITLGILVIFNVVVAVNSLMDYKTERLIDTNANQAIKYIYVK